MVDMYKLIESLCQQKRVSIAQMCRDIGVRQGLISDLKAGRTKILSAENISKIAVYFDVSIDFLLGNEQKKTPAKEAVRSVTNDDLKIALFGGNGEVTDEMWEEALFAAQLIKERHKRKKNNND